jgi:hypothetical protein
VSQEQARTASLIAAAAMGLWVLAIVALPTSRDDAGAAGADTGWPAAARIALVVAMAACIVAAFAIPLTRRIFALVLPPPSVLAAEAAIVAVAICALSLWRARADPSRG